MLGGRGLLCAKRRLRRDARNVVVEKEVHRLLIEDGRHIGDIIRKKLRGRRVQRVRRWHRDLGHVCGGRVV